MQLPYCMQNQIVLPHRPHLRIVRTTGEYTSWQMVFAKDEAEFNAMWQDLKTQLNGFGYQDLVKFDIEKIPALGRCPPGRDAEISKF